MTEWIGYAIGVLGVAVAVAAWLRPRHAARTPRNKVSGDIVVDTTNGWMTFDHPDGSSSFSDHLVIVTVRNVGHDRTLLKNWGISVDREGSIVDLGSLNFNPALPRWLDPGEDVSFHIPSESIRTVSTDRNVPFKRMHAFVGLGDGRTVSSKKPVPLS